jgi:hypothetical protein
MGNLDNRGLFVDGLLVDDDFHRMLGAGVHRPRATMVLEKRLLWQDIIDLDTLGFLKWVENASLARLEWFIFESSNPYRDYNPFG